MGRELAAWDEASVTLAVAAGAAPGPWRITHERTTRVLGAWNAAVLAAYLALLLGIGLRFARHCGPDDYFRASQRVPAWAAGLSIFATTVSSITLMAIPAKAYASDWVYALGNVGIVAVAPLIVLVFLPFFRRIDATSAYEYLERRFHVSLRLFGGLSFLLFQLGRMAIVLLLPAIALATVTPLSVDACILAMGLLSIVYSTVGGIRAVIWTDVCQALVLIGGALLCLVVAWSAGGAAGEVFELAHDQDKLRLVNWGWDATTTTLWVVVLGNTFTNLVTFTSDQAVVQRYMTTPTERAAARAIWTNAAVAVLATPIFYALGSALWVFYRTHPDRLEPTLATDAILPLFASRELPAGLAGLVIAAIFAAAQSTVSTSMNSTSTVLVTDVYRRFAAKRGEQHYLRVARVATALLGALGVGAAMTLAHAQVRSLLDAFTALLGLTTSPLGGLFLLGILTRRAHALGAGIGAACGIAALHFARQSGLHFFLYSAVGMLSCFAVGWLASCILPGTSKANGASRPALAIK